jgi:hypothetical protein
MQPVFQANKTDQPMLSDIAFGRVAWLKKLALVKPRTLVIRTRSATKARRVKKQWIKPIMPLVAALARQERIAEFLALRL